MCGIIGLTGPGISHWDLDLLRELAYLSGLRGMDSTGVFQGTVPKYGKQDILVEKSTYDVSWFQQYHRFSKDGNKDILSGIMNHFFCVHTRAATRGRISKENAHPFDFENIVGVHNGTLSSRKYDDPIKTDSEMLFKDINERGIIPVLEELTPKDAYAIVALDKKTGELIFTRNDTPGRPLHVCFNDNRAVMYWASEEWMLRAVFERNREKIYKNHVAYFKAGRTYRVHPLDIKYKNDAIFTIDEFKLKPEKTYSWVPENIRNWNERQNQKKDVGEVGRKSKSLIVINSENKHLDLLKEDIKSSKIPIHYCCSCHKRMSLTDIYFGRNISKSVFMHEECAKDLDIILNKNEPTEEVRIG